MGDNCCSPNGGREEGGEIESEEDDRKRNNLRGMPLCSFRRNKSSYCMNMKVEICRGVQMSISYRSNRDPAQPGGNAFFVSAANLLH